MTTSQSSFPSPEPVTTFAVGQKLLNRYKLDRVLGQGGMGIVWLARDEELDRDVALKFLPAVLINDRASLNDLKRETKRSLELTHPNIVRTYDFVQDSTIAGISMEYVDSDTLRNRKSDQPGEVFEPKDLGEWVKQLCEALDYAHQQAAIVHRDLKPANLLINGRNQIKVADFGISRSLVDSVTQVTGMRGSSGTLVYMSPQQLSGEAAHPLDDIYALGATLYELVTKRPPFYSGDITGQVYAKVPPSMAARRGELGVPVGEMPENWETTVAACLAKDPHQRPQSAGEIAVRLGLKEASSLTATVSSFPAPLTAMGTVRVPQMPAPAGSPTATSSPVARPPPLTPTPPQVMPPAPQPKGQARMNPAPIIAAIAAVFLVLIGAAWVIGSRFLSEPAKPTGPQAKPVVHQNPSGSGAPKPAETDPRLSPIGIGPAGAMGSVFVESDPPESIVKVDNRPAEKTPVNLRDLPPGKHTLTITRDGYEDMITQITVRENQTADTGKLALTRSTGWLQVGTNFPSADIAVRTPDDPQNPLHFTGSWKSDKIPTGDYQISVTRPGWAPITKQVTVVRDQPQTIPFNLSPGIVDIVSVPPKAKVLVDGKEVGVTPYHDENVQPGDVHYSLTYPNYVVTAVEGRVEAGQPLHLEGKLTKGAVAKAATPRPQPTVVVRRTVVRDDDRPSGSSSSKLEKAETASRIFRNVAPFLPHP